MSPNLKLKPEKASIYNTKRDSQMSGVVPTTNFPTKEAAPRAHGKLKKAEEKMLIFALHNIMNDITLVIYREHKRTKIGTV